MKTMIVLLLVGIIGVHLLPHTDHSGGSYAGSECRTNVCDKKQAGVRTRKEEERFRYEETAMEFEQIDFDYGVGM